MIKIHQPIGFNKLGGRSNNEDAIYPSPKVVTARTSIFMVCDGVGGKDKGEVASSMIATNYPRFIADHPIGINEDRNAYYQKGLQEVEEKMATYIGQHSDCEGMASTVTFLHVKENEIIIGWAGDSRIYHIRDGQILFKSEDHSLVNKLVQMGEITEIEALSHPQKNVIIRAVKGSEEPSKLDIQIISDVQKNDYFFLCTDGVLETLTDEQIKQWFTKKKNPDQIVNLLLQQAEGVTNDNYSAYLLKVKEGTSQGGNAMSGIWKRAAWVIPLLMILAIALLWFWKHPIAFPAFEVNVPVEKKKELPPVEYQKAEPPPADIKPPRRESTQTETEEREKNVSAPLNQFDRWLKNENEKPGGIELGLDKIKDLKNLDLDKIEDIIPDTIIINGSHNE